MTDSKKPKNLKNARASFAQYGLAWLQTPSIKDKALDQYSTRMAAAFNKHGDVRNAWLEGGYPERLYNMKRAQKIINSWSFQDYLRELNEVVREDVAVRFGVSAVKVVEALADIAFADPGEIYSWDEEGNMTFKASDQLSARQRRLVQHFQRTKGKSETTEVRLADRIKALDMLCKVTGAYEQDNAQRNGAGYSDEQKRVLQAMEETIRAKAMEGHGLKQRVH